MQTKMDSNKKHIHNKVKFTDLELKSNFQRKKRVFKRFLKKSGCLKDVSRKSIPQLGSLTSPD